MKTNGDAVRPMKQHNNQACPLLLILLILILIKQIKLIIIEIILE